MQKNMSEDNKWYEIADADNVQGIIEIVEKS